MENQGKIDQRIKSVKLFKINSKDTITALLGPFLVPLLLILNKY